MGWDVPWFVGGGANHGPEIARMLGYYATKGVDGILQAADCKVTQLDVPGGGVKVLPGAVAALNRAPAAVYQSYIGRLASAETVTVNPTASGGGRVDAVVARVEDPWETGGSVWPNPSDPTVGPYMRTRVIENVAQYIASPLTSVKSIADLGQGWTGVILALLNIPASTGTITDSMVVDLRVVTNPDQGDDGGTQEPPGDSNDGGSVPYVQWPNNVSWNIKIPKKANRATLTVSAWSFLGFGTSPFNGDAYLEIKNGSDLVTTPAFKLGLQWTGSFFSFSFGGSATVVIPSVLRNKTCTVKMYARRTSGTGSIKGILGSHMDLRAKYSEVPE